MGKKKQSGGLGRSIIRDRFGHKGRREPDSHLHTSELNDGYDWNKINLRSVTEETSLDEFLATAEMAGTEFIAEKLNIKFVSQDSRAGQISVEEQERIRRLQDEHRELLSIPRRPHWNERTTASELDLAERDSFLEWRRKLSQLQEVEGLVLTPFERNLEFWRQLWRVIERSDVIVQVVDARNPLLFRSEDLEKYVKEVDSAKLNLVLINKADYLTQTQREMWATYFEKLGVRVAFWSAVAETERLKEENKEAVQEEEEEIQSSSSEEEGDSQEEEDEDNDNMMLNTNDIDNIHITKDDEEMVCDDCHVNCDTSSSSETQVAGSGDSETSHITRPGDSVHHSQDITVSDNTDTALSSDTQSGTQTDTQTSTPQCSTSDSDSVPCVQNKPDILDGSQLIELFNNLHTGNKFTPGVTTIGMVGYPNVGKSSTINALLQNKKVPVSSTPGRTKHFQTLYLDRELMLCDCPGLVMPTFVSTKADMVISGILPIDQMRDYVGPTAAMCLLIPRQTFEYLYGIMIPKPREGEDETRPPTPHELLGAYGYMRGYMTHKGIPDFPRSARMLLKDFVNGKLLYSNPPPDCDVTEFCPTPTISKSTKERSHPQQLPTGSKPKPTAIKYRNEVDQAFFEKRESQLGCKSRTVVSGYQRDEQGVPVQYSSDTAGSSQSSLADKPWKRHHNRGKKTKLRRIHSHLDA